MFYNPLAITASSLDLHPSHSLPERIRAAASASSLAIETVYQELEEYALSHTPPTYTMLLEPSPIYVCP